MLNIKLFSLSSNKPLADEISRAVGIHLSDCTISKFADGEICVQINETVRGSDVYVIQSTSYPVSDNVMELLIMCDALRRASARSINLIIPYYGYSRMDKIKKNRQPITSKLIASMMERVGAETALLMDIHSTQTQGFFNCHVDNLLTIPVFYKYFSKKNLSDVVIVSPDHNGTSRARDFAATLDCQIAIIDKRYSEMESKDKMHIIGNVEGKTCIIVDDMCDTGITLAHAADFLKECNAKDIYAYCTHGVLSGNAVEYINNSALKELVVTNTILQTPDKKSDKITVISVGEYIGKALLRIIDNESLTGKFTYRFDKDSK